MRSSDGFDRKRRRLWALFLLMLAATILPTACGGGSSTVTKGPPPQNYNGHGDGNLGSDPALDHDFGYGAIDSEEGQLLRPSHPRTHSTRLMGDLSRSLNGNWIKRRHARP